MSVYSDYESGALSYEDYRGECARINREEAYYLEHEHDGYFEEDEEEYDEDEE